MSSLELQSGKRHVVIIIDANSCIIHETLLAQGTDGGIVANGLFRKELEARYPDIKQQPYIHVTILINVSRLVRKLEASFISISPTTIRDFMVLKSGGTENGGLNAQKPEGRMPEVSE